MRKRSEGEEEKGGGVCKEKEELRGEGRGEKEGKEEVGE